MRNWIRIKICSSCAASVYLGDRLRRADSDVQTLTCRLWRADSDVQAALTVKQIVSVNWDLRLDAIIFEVFVSHRETEVHQQKYPTQITTYRPQELELCSSMLADLCQALDTFQPSARRWCCRTGFDSRGVTMARIIMLHYKNYPHFTLYTEASPAIGVVVLRHPFHRCKKIFDDQFEVFWSGYDTTVLSSQQYFDFGAVLP